MDSIFNEMPLSVPERQEKSIVRSSRVTTDNSAEEKDPTCGPSIPPHSIIYEKEGSLINKPSCHLQTLSILNKPGPTLPMGDNVQNTIATSRRFGRVARQGLQEEIMTKQSLSLRAASASTVSQIAKSNQSLSSSSEELSLVVRHPVKKRRLMAGKTKPSKAVATSPVINKSKNKRCLSSSSDEQRRRVQHPRKKIKEKVLESMETKFENNCKGDDYTVCFSGCTENRMWKEGMIACSAGSNCLSDAPIGLFHKKCWRESSKNKNLCVFCDP